MIKVRRMITETRQTIVCFGKGTIKMARGFLEGKATMGFGRLPEKKELGEMLPPGKWNEAGIDVMLQFDNVKSITLLIKELRVLRRRMKELRFDS